MTITFKLQPLDNYAFGLKDAQQEEDTTIAARVQRLIDEYKTDGMRMSVEAVIVFHQHGHPHILLLQTPDNYFKLPGDQLKPKEEAVKGLKRILDSRLAPPGMDGKIQWNVGELLSNWYRPNFDAMMYPYLPAHVKMPKEQKQIYLVTMPEKCVLACPKNYKLVAVPLFDLYDNQTRFGPVIASIPHLLGRFTFTT